MELGVQNNAVNLMNMSGGASLRHAGKRATQAEDVEKNRKRAAFEDITNAKIGGNGAPAGQEQFPTQFKNPVYSLGSSQDTLAQRMHNVGLNGSLCCAAALDRESGVSPCDLFVDIDAEDAGDALACSELAPEIFERLRAAETRRRPSVSYMETVQTDVNALMRAILVDWLVEVAGEYKMHSDTLFLAVALVDRYLSVRAVPRGELQLAGVAAMWVAAKYEEIYPPSVDDFCYITDHTYTRAQLVAAESDLLAALGFDLTQPTAKTFLRRYLKAAAAELDLGPVAEHLSSYLCELALLDYGCLGFLPSTVAAASLMLALLALEQRPWTPTLAHYTGYALRDLRHAARALHDLALGAAGSQLPATRDKYAGHKYLQVSRIALPPTLPHGLFV